MTPEAGPKNAGDVLAFEIVKHVISVKVAERDAAAQATARAAQKQRILELVAHKEDAAMSEKSVDELKEMLRALG